MARTSENDNLMRQYQVRRTLRRAMVSHHSLGQEVVRQLWDSPDDLIALGTPLQDKERCLVARLDDGASSAVFKRQNWGGPWKTFCKCLRTPQARQSFEDGLFLLEHGISTPRPLALVEHKLGPFGSRSYLLTEFVRGTSLYRLMRFESPSSELIEHVAEQVATLCRTLVELNVSHNDLKPENLMVDPAGKVWLIDLEKFRRHSAREATLSRLLEDCKRLLHARNWRENRAAGETFRQRLLAEPVVAEALALEKPKKHPLVQAESFERGADNRLTVLVVGPASATELHTCVESFRDVADQIVVADSRSNLDVNDNANIEVVAQAENEPPVGLLNRALAKAVHPWVLVIAANERVTPDLAKELQCRLADNPKTSAFRVPRRRMFLGHVSKFGAYRGEAPVRLFRKEAGWFEMRNARPRLVSETAATARTKSKLMYLNCWHLSDRLRELDRRTSRLARQKHARGEKPALSGACFRSLRRFARGYFWRQAILDGAIGLQMSAFAAMEVLIAEFKLWEMSHARRENEPGFVRQPLKTSLFETRSETDVSTRRAA